MAFSERPEFPKKGPPISGGLASGAPKRRSSRSAASTRSVGGQDIPSSRDEDIPIPDFNLIRRIGSGAYGEVWLAQSITGALRAVKIVWREDFEFEKTFHREFEGIRQFEPISRGHRGLVNVLHVGWNEHGGFYYYVMELADDALHGADIDLNTYVPRTLTTDFKNNGRLNLEFCQQTGIFLAEALSYMHSYGLTHRDIKPSNIIFVKGACKLADIGLVAAHGERSFVGTEGFVPPEGPGTFAADIYSLGKVLYEISSGKDRMEFPEVPDDLTADEWKLWREWNSVICQACAPDLKERFASAIEFAEALRQIGVPKPEPISRRIWRGATTLVVGSVLLGSLISMAKREYDWSYSVAAPEIRVLSAEELAQAKFPVAKKLWLNSYDLKFIWKDDKHVAEKPVNLEFFTRFLEDSMQPFEGEVVATYPKGDKPEYTVVVPRADADSFCTWLTDQDRNAGALNGDFEYQWKSDESVKRNPGSRNDWTALKLELVKLHFGEVVIESVPPRAEVLVNGDTLGNTPLTLSRVRVGDASFMISLAGYKRELLKGKVIEGKRLKLSGKLKPTDAVAFGRKWKNSLGIDFEPLGSVLIAGIETRRTDYATFLRSIPSSVVPLIDISSDEGYPITHVSRKDAETFCQWLTQVELAKGLLEEGQQYRLPTDDEWSMAANLPRERGESPADRNQRIEGIYPWGFTWPPPQPPPGNFWDASAAEQAKRKEGIPNFNDGYPELAPVSSFAANEHGIRDQAGNVWEWVHENFGGSDAKQQRLGVVRGGSWKTFAREELLSSHRKAISAGVRADDIGFRLVLSTDGVVAREDDSQ